VQQMCCRRAVIRSSHFVSSPYADSSKWQCKTIDWTVRPMYKEWLRSTKQAEADIVGILYE